MNEESETNEILTRSKIQENPELRAQLIDLGNDPFKRKPKITRSPPKESNIYENLPGTSNTGATSKISKKEVTTKFNLSVPSPLEIVQTSPNRYFTPWSTDNTFDFNNTVDNKEHYTEIEGILNQETLTTGADNESISNFIENLITLTDNNTTVENKNSNMSNESKPSRLSLIDVADLVPTFDGKNIPVEEYIEKLKQARKLIDDVDENRLIEILKVRLQGNAQDALKRTKINTMIDLIHALRTLYPKKENLHKLYGALTDIQQEPDESVLSYVNRLQNLVSRIKELKKLEEGITEEYLNYFNTNIDKDAAIYFKDGLKFEIEVKLGECTTLPEMSLKAIDLESKLEKHLKPKQKQSNIINTKSKLYSAAQDIQPARCQICKDTHHEALFCNTTACVYCRGNGHVSNDCNIAEKKFKLFCKCCNGFGHSISFCNFNKDDRNYCQYCQETGHEVVKCPFIMNYQLCWKCRKAGHNPNICPNENNKTCDICNKTGHNADNCIKISDSKIEKSKILTCSLCEMSGHDVSDCEYKIVVNQLKSGRQIICQLCDKVGHSGKNCFKSKNLRDLPQQNHNLYNQANNNFSNNRSNNSFQQKFCEYCKFSGHMIDECRKIQALKSQNSTCAYCKKLGHVIDDCRILKQLENKTSSCSYCKKLGHTIDACNTLKSKTNKYCNTCKRPGHTDQQCYRNLNQQRNFQGNE